MSTKWADGPFPLIETPEFRLKKNTTSKRDEESDQYVRGASIMALVHNFVIRGLNSIYLQAPHVESKDCKDFIGYCYCWYQSIDKAFEAGLEDYKTYLLSLEGQETEFSAAKLLSIIDSFAPALMAHLAEEIPTILALSRFGSKVRLLEISEVEMRKASDAIPKTEGLPFFMMNLDRSFEDGMWEFWPPIPGAVRWVLIRVFAWKHAGWWRFASCDYNGYPKNLYAAS